MTTNKAQGQTLDRAGLFLPVQCFSYGQLYVALSKVKNRDAIRVVASAGAVEGRHGVFVKNMVQKELLISCL